MKKIEIRGFCVRKNYVIRRRELFGVVAKLAETGVIIFPAKGCSLIKQFLSAKQNKKITDPELLELSFFYFLVKKIEKSSEILWKQQSA